MYHGLGLSGQRGIEVVGYFYVFAGLYLVHEVDRVRGDGVGKLTVGVLGCHAGQIGVDHDASAVFTHDDFLVHLDFHLLLGRDAVEAAAAGVALDVDDAEAVAGVLADALEGGEGAWVVDAGFEVFGIGAEHFLVFLGLGDDFFELLTLVGKDVVAVNEALLGCGDVGCLGVDLAAILAYALSESCISRV